MKIAHQKHKCRPRPPRPPPPSETLTDGSPDRVALLLEPATRAHALGQGGIVFHGRTYTLDLLRAIGQRGRYRYYTSLASKDKDTARNTITVDGWVYPTREASPPTTAPTAPPASTARRPI